MKTKYYFLAAMASVVLVSCSSDDFVAEAPPADNTQEYGVPIMFSSLKRGMTRADFEGADAAKLLNNNFVVSGYKGAQTKWNDDDNVIVFDNYLVNYEANTAHTTESNSDNWEYVGKGPIKHAKDHDIVKQTIKYWDYSRDQYDFFAWATGKWGEGENDVIKPVYEGTPVYNNHEVLISAITPENAFETDLDKIGTTGTDNKVIRAYSFTGKAADLTNCYISDIVTVLKVLPDGQTEAGTNQVVGYNQPVTLKFRQLGAKVRMGIYETVPGYSVKNVSFYTVATSTSEDDKGQEKPTLFTTEAGQIYDKGTYYIYFPTVDAPTNADNNQAHIKFEGTSTDDQLSTIDYTGLQYTIAELGEKGDETGNMSIYLGRTSNTASMAGRAEGNYYTQYLPNEQGTNLNLRVNYTLEAIDGSGEIIEVKGATAQVPAIYTQWKAGYAYTYLFKISDKTNGYTGVYNPANPDGNTTESNPAGLYPITFDAYVVNAEDGDATQETITTVSAPSITTYQKGSTVVNKNEYLADTGDIYVTVNDTDAPDKTPDLANGKLQSLKTTETVGQEEVTTTKAALYTLPANAEKDWTEAYVIDALTYQDDNPGDFDIKGRNGLGLTEADLTITNEVRFGVDGNVITVGENQAAYFTPEPGIYAFVYTKTAATEQKEIYQPVAVNKDDNVNGYWRGGLKNADAGDVQKGVVYFTSKTSGKVDVFYGQTVNNLYLDNQGKEIASGYAVSGTDYYYTTDGGFTYTKAENVAYEYFTATTTKDIGTGNTDATWQKKNADGSDPVSGTAYYKRVNTGTENDPVYTYTYCVILPQQTNAADKQLLVYKPGTYWECKENEKAVEGMLYYDKYIWNNGVRYAKVIKVQ